MITPKNIQPEKSLYSIGATVISVMKKTGLVEVEPEVIYRDFSAVYPMEISYNYFIYSLDWLFLVGIIELKEDKKKIKRCF